MRKAVLFGVVGVIVLVVGVGAFLFVAGGSGEPSTDLTTPTIPDEPTTSTGEEATSTDGVVAGATTFVIVAGESEARFEVDEILRGQDNQVMGTTGEVAGQIRVDLEDLSSAEMSQIVVNARTFETGSGLRDRAIRGPVILNSASDEFEIIVFEPSTIEELAGQATEGNDITFTVAGDLTIKGTTAPAVFEVVATLAGDGRIEGSATTTVMRSDFGIGIPNVASVTFVDEEVTLVLDFVATAR